MKALIFLSLFFFAVTIKVAEASFKAKLNDDQSVLSINLSDDQMSPPYEAGELWKIMQGDGQRKRVQEGGLDLECEGVPTGTHEVFGECTLSIPMESFQKIGTLQIFKLKGSAASRMNHYFMDNAYLSIQGGQVYISAYTTRREFIFGIQDELIQR